MAMYQSIDEIEDDERAAPAQLRRSRIFTLPFILAIIVVSCAVLYFGTRRPAVETPQTNEVSKAERASYHAAISEPSPAMRRARLTDFLSTYPKSGRKDSVRAMLGVVNVAEADDWAVVTETIFNPDLSRVDKIASLDKYEIDWGASLLGGREPEITALREELSVEIKKFPSRKMKEEKSSVPDDIEDEVMLGGLIPIQPDDDDETDAKDPDDDDETIKLTEQKVVGPKLRRPSNPKYPSKAYRKKISALVTVSLDIDSRGRVRDVEVVSVEAKAYQKDFAKASRRAAKRSRYAPRTVNGKPVATRGHVKRYRFMVE